LPVLLACGLSAQTASPVPPAAKAAAALQRQTVQKQADIAGLRLPDWDAVAEVSEPPPCDAMADSLLQPIIEAAAKAPEVQPGLLRAVIEQESGLRPCAISAKGAQGLMQLMPATVEQFALADPFDPKENVGAGAKYLKQLLDKYKGEWKLALAAYNAGPAVVDEAAGVPPFAEIQDYVEAILKKMGK
jgi:soluble lytic murein transglycosylase-like protein